MTFIPFDRARKECMEDPEFLKAYEALDEEFQLVEELIKARKEARMSQQEVAAQMGTSQAQIVRLESGKGTISSLRRYAHATGKKLKVTLE